MKPNLLVVRQGLYQDGIRLASILNEMLGTESSMQSGRRFCLPQLASGTARGRWAVQPTPGS